eukprot:4290604-Alexandrium_andersonii.AAC.1
MSASLVGSEMCIRDRELIRQGRFPNESVRQGTASPTDRFARGPSRQGTCLLYTSDAADDM